MPSTLVSASRIPRGMSLDDFPRVSLMFGPSPVHPLPRLCAALGGKVEIWAKREDCNSGIAFGGNKVRKLEYLAADALAQGCDTLVSIGGIQSNHTRAVTGVARHLGLNVVTVQEHWVDWDDPGYEVVGNIQLTRIMGGDVRIDPRGLRHRHPRLAGARRSTRSRRRAASHIPIPAGASDHPLGGLGFANWVREVARAGAGARRLLRHRDRVHGHRLNARGHDRGHRARGQGRPPSDRHRCLQDAGEDGRPGEPDRPIHRAGDRRRPRPARRRDHGGGRLRGTRPTASPTSQTIEAIHLAARTEGMLTDPVYEGKSMAGLIGMIRSGEIPRRLARAVRPPRRPTGAECLRPHPGPGRVEESRCRDKSPPICT